MVNDWKKGDFVEKQDNPKEVTDQLKYIKYLLVGLVILLVVLVIVQYGLLRESKKENSYEMSKSLEREIIDAKNTTYDDRVFSKIIDNLGPPASWEYFSLHDGREVVSVKGSFSDRFNKQLVELLNKPPFNTSKFNGEVYLDTAGNIRVKDTKLQEEEIGSFEYFIQFVKAKDQLFWSRSYPYNRYYVYYAQIRMVYKNQEIVKFTDTNAIISAIVSLL